MNRLAHLFFLVVPLAAAAGCASDPEYHGPMAVRNQHPAQLTVMHMNPRTVQAPEQGAATVAWTNAYTNMFLGGQATDGSSFEMDGEYWRSAVGARVGLGDGVDLEVELAAAHTTGGFLDHFVEEWHSAFGLPDQGRDTVPQQRFRVAARDRGTDVWSVERDGFEFLDFPIVLAWNAIPIPDGDRGFGFSVRGGVELPFGDDHEGFGSGGPDWSAGAFGEWRGDWFAVTAQGQHTWVYNPDPADRAGFTFRDVTSFGGGLELPLTNTVTALVQTEYETSTLRNLNLPRAADDQWLLWTGFRARLAEDWRLELALGEDLSPNIAPDFTLWLSLSFDADGF